MGLKGLLLSVIQGLVNNIPWGYMSHWITQRVTAFGYSFVLVSTFGLRPTPEVRAPSKSCTELKRRQGDPRFKETRELECFRWRKVWCNERPHFESEKKLKILSEMSVFYHFYKCFSVPTPLPPVTETGRR